MEVAGRQAATRRGVGEVIEASEDRDGRMEEEHPGDHNWAHDGSRFQCVVDNQVVAGTVNGTCALTDETVRHMFRDIAGHMGKLFGLGLRPPRDWLPPVEWRPRRFNKRSDAICNLILDGADSLRTKERMQRLS